MLQYYIIGLLTSYLIGSIPFAYIVAKAIGGIDIRQQGSGNVGATNVGRVMGWPYGVGVFILDMLKGLLPVYLASIYFVRGPGDPLPIICGLGAILGHIFPVYLRFQGGKAAATSFGVFFWLAPKSLVVALVVWGITVAITRYVSLGSILAAVGFCAALLVLGEDPLGQGRYLTIVSFVTALLIILRHKENISRLLAGTERKLGQQGPIA